MDLSKYLNNFWTLSKCKLETQLKSPANNSISKSQLKSPGRYKSNSEVSIEWREIRGYGAMYSVYVLCLGEQRQCVDKHQCRFYFLVAVERIAISQLWYFLFVKKSKRKKIECHFFFWHLFTSSFILCVTFVFFTLLCIHVFSVLKLLLSIIAYSFI